MEDPQQRTGEMAWDAQISNDDPEFEVLPDGEYDFEVKSLQRARHNGSEKLRPCPMAKLGIRVKGNGEIDAYLTHRFFLDYKCEGMICAFFRCVGGRLHGETMTMDWNKVVGLKGRCKLGHHTYKNKEYNEIKAFIDPAQSLELEQNTEELEGMEGAGFTAGAF